jgi:NADH:ubiquinone oxidoreductase subunit 5 (subunit L)/multisubunit Na+/H+ antiporter MnhA subunit
MTVLLLAAVAIGFGLVTIVVGPTWRRIAVAIGVVGSLAVLAIALSMPAEESLALGGVGLVGTPLVREMAVAWSAGLAALGLLEVGVGGRPTVVGPGLVGLAVAVVALATRDPASSVAALAAGGVAGVLVPGLSGWIEGADAPSRLATTSRGSLAVLGSGLLGLAVIAFGASAAGPLGAGAAAPNDPGVRLAAGLALLAMVGAVAIRCGLIPLHLWAARFMEGVSPLAIPALFAWGSAAFVLVAIDWSQVALGPTAAGDTERLLIIVVSFVSLVLGGLAAMVHDDIEHVLGYSILQDAGVAVLAFASLEPEVAAAARNWLVASATIKTALAAWAAVVRSTYGGHRLADLGGWARHSPVLGVSFAAILVAAVGLPGIAIWESRSSLISSAMPGLAAIVTPLIAMMPVIYLGRIALAGVEPVGRAVAAGPSGRPSWKRVRTAGWSEGGRLDLLRAVPAQVRANRVPLMALGVLLLAGMAVVTAIGGTGG